jgi:DAK2 domain fusion protein YloV
VCNGTQLLAALRASAAWLEGHRASVDALNVFPVPDGDTGTNMALTLGAALRQAENCATPTVGTVAEGAARGALMGARGNSGVILSQLLHGFARAVRDQHHIGAAELAAGLSAAAEAARRSVTTPVEGTILTVAAAAATAAAAAAERSDDLVAVLDAALEETRAAVARTPEQLPLLKQAGVVDAGAQGYLLVVEGAARYLHGLPVATDQPAVTDAALHMAHVAHGDDYGYCTEFAVVGPDLNLATIREAIAQLGESTLVVGDEGIVHIHVHTADPGRVLSYAAPLGRLHQVKIESMQEQHDRFVAQANVAAGAPPDAVDAAQLPLVRRPAMAGRTGVVAVAPGEGLAAVFRSLGADIVVPGGQTMNPSTEELLTAIDALPQHDVLLLPNNDNVLAAAAQARDLSPKAVTIVPTRTVPQGTAALVAYSPDGDAASNAVAMEEAAAGVRTGEITVAVRDAQMAGLVVRAGEVLGLLDGRPVCTGTDRDAVALDLLEHMGARDADVLTLYYGRDVTEREAHALAQRVRERYGGPDVEVVSGGQPYYPYIMSIE